MAPEITPRRPPRIEALPRDSGLWRVSWFGAVAFPDRSGRWTQPSISVILSRCFTLDGDINPAHLVDSEEQSCWASVGALSVLRAGDIWQNQALVSTPDYEIAFFPELLIDEATSYIIKAGFEAGSSGFLLPFSQHPWHKRDTHSKCVLVELPDQRNLVVPCIEIVRFYFGSSSDLLSRLFHTPLKSSDFFERVDHSVSGFRMDLDLADGIPRASASDVARIAGSRIAWRSAIEVSTSCARAQARGRRAYPSTHFPFRGRTDLVASGRWLGVEKKTFLVYSLRSCSHPFPFRTLRYRLGAQTAANVRRRCYAAKNTQADASSSRSDQSTLQEREPSSRLTRSDWLMERLARFPDLERKKISKDPSHALLPPPLPGRGGSKNSTDAALGIGVGGGLVRPLTLSYVEEALSSAPGFLRDVLSALQGLMGTRLTHLTNHSDDGWSVRLTLGQAGESLDGTNDSSRRVAGFVLESSTLQWFLLIVIDNDPTCVLLHSVPVDEQGEVIIPDRAAIRQIWASALDREDAELTLGAADEHASEVIGSWIREQMAADALNRIAIAYVPKARSSP